VRNTAGETLGKIEDVIVDTETGDVQYAVISFGGVLGMADKLIPIPWRSLNTATAPDYVLLNVDKESLQRAPGFQRGAWPDVADPAWRRRVDEYYGVYRPVMERRVYIERRNVRSPGLSVIGSILLLVLVLGLAWVTFLVGTRGWGQAREDMRSSIERVAYAAKETSHDAALTTKVKTALTLSKRIPANQIDVDSQGDVVTLRGEVPSEEIRNLAESLTRDVPGVSDVQNHLFAIKPSK